MTTNLLACLLTNFNARAAFAPPHSGHHGYPGADLAVAGSSTTRASNASPRLVCRWVDRDGSLVQLWSGRGSA